MRVLFIYSSQKLVTPHKPLLSQIHFGISYISSLLKSKGHHTKLLLITQETRQKQVCQVINNYKPGLICFTAVFNTYDLISRIAREIKTKFKFVYLVIGGPHTSLNPRSVLEDSFDALCVGEGEYPTLELVEQLEKGLTPKNIKNLWIKSGQTIEINETREFIQDLESLPFPDRDIWKDWIKFPQIKHTILLGRGCPFQCTYCCNHALSKLSEGNYVRFRSSKSVIKESRQIVKEFPETKEIYFEIETIGLNLKFVHDLCLNLEKFNKKLENPLTFGVNLRVEPNKDYYVLFKLLKRANFGYVNIGLESGSDKIRREVLNRNYSNNDILKTAKLAKTMGLKVNLYFMIGLPGEDLIEFQKTIKVLKLCQPDWIVPYIFYPYPGTAIYDLCKKKGLLKHSIPKERERYKAVLDLPNFSKKQIQRQFNRIYFSVYWGYKSPYELIKYFILQKAMSNSYVFLISHRIINSKAYLFLYRKLKNSQ